VNARNFPRWLLLPYAIWAWTVFLLLGLGVLMLIMPVPRQSLRRRLVHLAARAALFGCGMPVRLQHAQRLPHTPCVVVANHASYLDGVVLYAVLPPRFGFVIKREMSRVPLANLLLRRIGSHYVDRGSAAAGSRDTRRLFRRAHAGDALAIFAEGTFEPRPGLAAFRSGAFAIAARSQLPIVPVAIRGTRRALPGDSFLPCPARIVVELAPPVAAPASTADAAVAVTRRAVRQAILARIHEPDLAPES